MLHPGTGLVNVIQVIKQMVTNIHKGQELAQELKQLKTSAEGKKNLSEQVLCRAEQNNNK